LIRKSFIVGVIVPNGIDLIDVNSIPWDVSQILKGFICQSI